MGIKQLSAAEYSYLLLLDTLKWVATSNRDAGELQARSQSTNVEHYVAKGGC